MCEVHTINSQVTIRKRKIFRLNWLLLIPRCFRYSKAVQNIEIVNDGNATATNYKLEFYFPPFVTLEHDEMQSLGKECGSNFLTTDRDSNVLRIKVGRSCCDFLKLIKIMVLIKMTIFFVYCIIIFSRLLIFVQNLVCVFAKISTNEVFIWCLNNILVLENKTKQKNNSHQTDRWKWILFVWKTQNLLWNIFNFLRNKYLRIPP